MPRPEQDHGRRPKTFTAVGKRGTVVIPAALRRKLNIDEGTLILIQEYEDGVLLRPARVQRIDAEARRRFFEDLDRRLMEIQRDESEVWQDMLEEAREWDTTLMDGLDEDEVWSDEDLGLSPGAE